MKIRNGFVSNSSSSSFIISTENFKSVRELATYMIKKQIEEYSEREEENYINRYKIKIDKLKNINENQSISFSSCNYDTYIKKVDDCYLVSTCNNTDWDLYKYSTTLTNSAKESLKEISKLFSKTSNEYGNIEDILNSSYEFYAIGKDYYNLDSDIIGVETYDKCPNSKDIDYGHYLWDTIKYGKICPKCNPYFERKDKLDKINNSQK